MKMAMRLSKVLSFFVLLGLTACGGGGGGSAVSSSAVIPATTKVLDTATMQKITAVSTDGSTLTFGGDSAQLGTIAKGDVIVGGTGSASPYGFLRKVTNVSRTSSGIEVQTATASLENAVEEGKLTISTDLKPKASSAKPVVAAGVTFDSSLGTFSVDLNDVVLYDADGNASTTNDQIRANGSISLKPSFSLDMEIHHSRLEKLNFTTTAVERADISLSSSANLAGMDKRVKVFEQELTTIVGSIGPVPVTITPVLAIYVGLKGDISVGISTGVTQDATFTAGLSYQNKAWTPIKDFSNSYNFTPPTLTASASAKCYAGPQLDFKFYGVAGPYANVNGYLQLDANPVSTPWWQLYGGIEANAGVEISLLSDTISAHYEANIIDYRKVLAQANTPYVHYGSVSGSVKDAVTGSALAGVSVTATKLGNSVASNTTGTDGLYSLQLPAGNGYSFSFTKTGYMTAGYSDIGVDTDTTKYLEAILQIDSSHSGTGTVTGKIINAFDGSAISGATIKLRQGINATTGNVVATTTSQTNGSYSFSNLSAGNYTGEASKTGYNTSFFTVTCIGGTATGNQNASMTMILPTGQTRIVLTWGASPSDLDSHLMGPLSDGTRFHMYYPLATTNGGSTWPSYVKLDLDDTSSYGPETTTIYQQIAGVYRFSVHDYSNAGSYPSYALSNSNAVVRVYRGSSLIATFNVPANRGGTLWTIFEMNGDTITPVNNVSYESSSPSVQKVIVGNEAPTDAYLLQNLPSKK